MGWLHEGAGGLVCFEDMSMQCVRGGVLRGALQSATEAGTMCSQPWRPHARTRATFLPSAQGLHAFTRPACSKARTCWRGAVPAASQLWPSIHGHQQHCAFAHVPGTSPRSMPCCAWEVPEGAPVLRYHRGGPRTTTATWKHAQGPGISSPVAALLCLPVGVRRCPATTPLPWRAAWLLRRASWWASVAAAQQRCAYKYIHERAHTHTCALIQAGMRVCRPPERVIPLMLGALRPTGTACRIAWAPGVTPGAVWPPDVKCPDENAQCHSRCIAAAPVGMCTSNEGLHMHPAVCGCTWVCGCTGLCASARGEGGPAP